MSKIGELLDISVECGNFLKEVLRPWPLVGERGRMVLKKRIDTMSALF